MSRRRASFWDRALAYLGLQRAQPQASAYSGALSNRLTADWIMAPIQSADQEIRGDLRTLRGRAREMVRNNSYAGRYVDLVADNVIGPNGIRLQSRVTRANGEFDRGINDAIEDAWERWGEPLNCSADGRLSWLDVQHLAVRGRAQDGEALIRLLPGFANDFGFAVQVLDPDMLDSELSQPAGDGTNEIRMGVEVDRWGRPLAYHLWTAHPSERGQTRERVRVPADQIIHLFLVRRAGQTRGVTDFAPVLLDAKMLSGYQEAELVAARTAAAKMGFFSVDPEAVDPALGLGGGEAAEPMTMEADPGRFDVLPPGYTLHQWDPQHPNSAFKDFSKSILRSIATGLGVSYNTLANDLESVNYSSIRAGLLSERDAWRRLQVLTYTHLHRRVYREWMKWALTTGALELPSRNAARWGEHAWLPRGWDWVDPLKDITAATLAIHERLDSRTRVAGEKGRDFEEILADLDREQQLAREYEVGLPARPGGSEAPGGPPDDAEAAEDAAYFELAHRLRNGNGNHANGKAVAR